MIEGDLIEKGGGLITKHDRQRGALLERGGGGVELRAFTVSH